MSESIEEFDLKCANVETFSRAVGQTFDLTLMDGKCVKVELASAQSLPERYRSKPGARLPFTLLFRGAPEVVFGQGMYRMTHDELGAMMMFLVPVEPDETGPRYEAVFN